MEKVEKSLIKFGFLSAILLISLMAGRGYAQVSCAQAYSPGPTQASTSSALEEKELSRVLNYSSKRAKLTSYLAILPTSVRDSVVRIFDDIEFYDYRDMIPRLVTNFFTNGKSLPMFSRLYDTSRSAMLAPAMGFINAKVYIEKEKPPVTTQTFLEIQKRAMANGVEGVKSSNLGVFRSVEIIGEVPYADRPRLAETELANINNNPYLSFTQSSEGLESDSVPALTRVNFWGDIPNDSIAERAPVKVYSGEINYPWIRTSKQQTVDVIKEFSPQVWQQVTEWRTAHTGENAPKNLETAFLKALTDERISRFNSERANLGELTQKNIKEFIGMVADLQSSLISIHPCVDGNGRSSRLFMENIFMQAGLPTPHLLDVDLDILESPEQWRAAVIEGVMSANELQDEIYDRLAQGLPIASTPELIYPLPLTMSINGRKESSSIVVKDQATVAVNLNQFTAFLQTLADLHPEIKGLIQSGRLATMKAINEMFTKWYKSKTIQYNHSRDGIRNIALRFVDQDFIETFGVVRASRKDLWDTKIDRYYDREMVVWRGLADQQHVYSDDELLSMFTAPSLHMASNAVVNAAGGKADSALGLMKKDFLEYNRELLSGDFIQLAIDHHTTGPLYNQSLGYSTSKRYIVGQGFAMGAMVVADYGKQNDPQFQEKIKSRIVVGSLRAEKDVDLGRLHQFADDFKYKYFRQAEVMGIGGADPDSIMYIQRLGPDGKVIDTFARNIEKPNEILRISGHWIPTESPVPTERIIERLEIKPDNTVVRTAGAAPQI